MRDRGVINDGKYPLLLSIRDLLQGAHLDRCCIHHGQPLDYAPAESTVTDYGVTWAEMRGMSVDPPLHPNAGTSP
jgi:hypothetical protein